MAIVGAPTDDLVSDRPGTRFGPRAIRAASCPPGPHLEAGVDAFAELRLVDFGDAPVVPGDAAALARGDRADGRRVVAAGAIPIVLGGDHSIAEPDIRACAARSGPSGCSTSTPTPTPGRRSSEPSARTARRCTGWWSRPRGPRPLRAGRPARLLARRGRVRLAARAAASRASSSTTCAARHRGGGGAGAGDRRPGAGVHLGRHRRARPRVRARHRHARAGRDDQRRAALGLPRGRARGWSSSAPNWSR